MQKTCKNSRKRQHNNENIEIYNRVKQDLKEISDAIAEFEVGANGMKKSNKLFLKLKQDFRSNARRLKRWITNSAPKFPRSTLFFILQMSIK